jgi:hypothetical protein
VHATQLSLPGTLLYRSFDALITGSILVCTNHLLGMQ